MHSSENVIFSNSFGNVTDNLITLNYRSGPAYIRVEQINSISFQHRRNYLFSIGSFLALVPLLIPLFITDIVDGRVIVLDVIIILFALLSGIANWIGHHNIVVIAGGQIKKPLRVEMAKTQDGRQFVDVVKKLLPVDELLLGVGTQ